MSAVQLGAARQPQCVGRLLDLPLHGAAQLHLGIGEFIRERVDAGLQPCVRDRICLAAEFKPLPLLLNNAKLLQE